MYVWYDISFFILLSFIQLNVPRFAYFINLKNYPHPGFQEERLWGVGEIRILQQQIGFKMPRKRQDIEEGANQTEGRKGR